MKLIKLLIIFLVLSGAIFLILNWSSLFPSTPPQKEENWSEMDKLDITKECKKIRDAWAQETGWNEELYKSQRADIDQSKAMGLFSMKGYDAVDRCLHETATNKACDGYMDALHKQPFSAADLNKQYSGVQMVKKSEKLGNDPRSTKVEQIHKLYLAVQKFIGSKHQITAKFNSNTNSWLNFDAEKNKILQEARALNQNPLFSEISMIPGFKDGLNSKSLESKFAGMRNTFYQQLCNQIINHYQNVAVTQDNYNRLEAVLVEFKKQSKNQKLVSNIEQVQYELGKKIYKQNTDEQ